MVFPDHLTQLNEGLFQDCTALTTCHLPAQLKVIDSSMLYNTAITTIEIPEQVTSIGRFAFGSCLSMKELTLPASVVELADSVFGDDTKLDKLTLDCTVPPTVVSDTFDDDDYATTLIVPQGTLEAYRQHDIWGRFVTIKEKE